MKVTEKTFIKQLKRGKEEAMEYVIANYGGIIRSIVQTKLSYFQNEQEDCISEIFFAIWEHADCYQESRGTFLNWVCGIARFKCIDYYRKHHNFYEMDCADNLELIVENQAEQALKEMQLQEEFEELISCLSDGDRHLFRQYFWEEKSADEICADTGMKKANIYNHISKGKAKIKKTFSLANRR